MGSDLVSAEEARGLLAGATPGPWSAEYSNAHGFKVRTPDTHPNSARRRGSVIGSGGYARGTIPVVINSHPDCEPRSAPKADAALIAAAPALARMVVALSEELAEARATLDNERGEGEPPSDGWRWDCACWVRDLPSNEQLRVSWDATGLDTELPRWRCWPESADDWGGAFIVPSAPTARAAMRDADRAAVEAPRG